MTPSATPTFTIGEFSRMARISVRMLRHYDERGLLGPVSVDPWTGYRRYSGEQLRTAARICALRDAGFPVAEIARVLAETDPAVLRQVFEAQRDRLVAEVSQAHQRLARVDHLITTVEARMSVDVERTRQPARTIAALRDIIPGYGDERLLWGRLDEAFRAGEGTPSLTGWVGATFHDEDYQDRDVDVEVWAEVTEQFADAGDLRCLTMPEQDVAQATITGPYEQVGAASAAIGEWIAAHGLRLAGSMFAVYRVGPAQDPDPARWVTDLCYPVRDADQHRGQA